MVSLLQEQPEPHREDVNHSRDHADLTLAQSRAQGYTDSYSYVTAEYGQEDTPPQDRSIQVSTPPKYPLK